METFLTCMNAVAPLFVLMAVAYVARMAGVLGRQSHTLMSLGLI